VKHQLAAAIAVTAMISAAGSPLAANLLLSAAAPEYLAKMLPSELGARTRPPSVQAFAPTGQGAVLAMAGTSSNARDNHVLEFLRWKEKHSAMRRTVSQ
jgi:hypothetical protein